ncbi:MAG: gadC [Gammaproteobacteria bacterium]|jgi:amino acid transporter|nr:gadC [Gammaproteobacteria bacterium]
MTGIKKIGTFALVMLIVGGIDSVRNLPATALFGTALIFFSIASALVFLIPSALVSAELSSSFPEHGGIYQWVKLAFGEKIAFLSIWLQWINTMVWFPSILSFIAGTLAYLINPALADNKAYLISVILIVFWGLTLLNLKGLHVSAKFSKLCTIIGTLIPMGLIIILAVIWLFLGKPIQLHFTHENLLPNLHTSDNWVALIAIMTAFLGMELVTVHVKEVKDPHKSFPRALSISVVMILTTMLLGSLAIALVLPANQINLVNGVMQAFSNFFANYHLSWLIPIMTAALVVGNLGGMVTWVISPAKGLLQASQSGFLPKFLAKENENGVAANLLLVQAILVSLFCMAFLLMPSVNGSYWLLSDLSTQLYMLMYVMMFIAAVTLKYKFKSASEGFSIPGKKCGMWITCLLGLFGCAVTLIVGFIPPSGIDVGGFWHYEIIFIAGMLAMIVPVLGFYYYHSKENFKKLCYK